MPVWLIPSAIGLVVGLGTGAAAGAIGTVDAMNKPNAVENVSPLTFILYAAAGLALAYGAKRVFK